MMRLSSLRGDVPDLSTASLGHRRPPGRVLVQQLAMRVVVGEAFLQRTLLDCFQILRRDPNVQAAMLSERCLGGPNVTCARYGPSFSSAAQRDLAKAA